VDSAIQRLNNRGQFRFQRSFAGVLSREKDTVFTRKSAASSQQQYVAWDQAPQWRKKTKNELKQLKNILARGASRAVDWGGEKAPDYRSARSARQFLFLLFPRGGAWSQAKQYGTCAFSILA